MLCFSRNICKNVTQIISGNYFVMGGSMNGKGGKILGDYPDDLTEAGPLNINRGRFIPTTSWDAIFNAVAQWAGITNEADMAKVLPNRNKFSRLFSSDELFQPDPIPLEVSRDIGNEVEQVADQFLNKENLEDCTNRLKDLITASVSRLNGV